MKILVTGATGTLGANVVKQLVEKGYQVRSQVRSDSKKLTRIERFGTEIFPFDLSSRAGMADLVRGVDAVIHLAMWTGINGKPCSEPFLDGLLDINMASTLFLLEAVRLHNPSIKRFVQASSSVLYPQVGFNAVDFQEKDKKARPVGMYAVSKLVGELFAHSYHCEHGIPTVTLTIPELFCGRELFGERLRSVSPFLEDHIQALEGAPPSKVRNLSLRALQQHAKDGKKLLIPLTPEGKPWRRHLGDVRDVARACVLALDAPKAVGETLVIMSNALDYGLGTPHLSEITGMKYVDEFVPFGSCYWYDLQKTKDVLGFYPQFDSRRMIEDAWKHYRGEDIGIIDGDSYAHISRNF